MWREGGPGQDADLIAFYEKVCQSGSVLSVSDVSYRSDFLRALGKGSTAGHVSVSGTLELSVEGRKLFGTLQIAEHHDTPAMLKDQDLRRAVVTAIGRKPRLLIDTMQNYSEEGKRVSLYAGDPCHGESWSVHCNIP